MGVIGLVNTYTKLIGKHKGENCIILGAGLSLYDLCISHYFKDILDNVVISVNSAFIPLSKFNLNPEKHYWISNDVLCRNWSYWGDIKKSNCTKVVRDSWLKYKDELDGFLYFESRSTPEDVVDFEDDDGLCYCSSIPTSIDLALKLGVKNIFLFGVDHCRDSSNRHYYWQLLYDRENWPTASANIYDSWEKQEKVFEYNNKAYKALSKFAKYKNVNVYNCSDVSKVTTFDKMSIDNVFKIIGEKK